MKGNNRLVKVAVEDTKHVTSLVKQEMLALKEQIHAEINAIRHER
jgi:hypothetical protein